MGIIRWLRKIWGRDDEEEERKSEKKMFKEKAVIK